MNYTVSTVPFNFVPMPMVNNTVLVMSETNSTLSKENNSKRKNNAYIGEYRKQRKTDKNFSEFLKNNFLLSFKTI